MTAMVFGVIGFLSVAAHAEDDDYGFRFAIYHVGRDANTINTAPGAQYAVPGQKITLNKSVALNCQSKTCNLRLGVFATRKNAAQAQTVAISALNESGPYSAAVKSVSFAKDARSAAVIFDIKLDLGTTNTIMMKINPDRTLKETDYTNNAFESTILLEGSAAPITLGTPKEAIERAFKAVYGYPTDAQRFAYWESQKADYGTILSVETGRLNAEPIARKLMITRVYKDTFGRIANKKEIDYWLPKTEIYQQIFMANREYLYSPGGVTDLIETVKRALTTNNGKTPSDDEVKQAASRYRQTKAIYDEMK